MSAIAAGMVVSAGIGAASSASAAKRAAQAAKDSQVDINKLDQQTRDIARRNALESAALEKELTPEVAQLRTDATNAVLGGIGTTQHDANTMASLYGMMNRNAANTQIADTNTPLLAAAIAKAKQELALGGALDQNTRNAVMRGSLGTAGGVAGGAGLGLGRDISSRDLGLTSMQLAAQRLQNASAIGAQELNQAQGNQANAAGNRAYSLDALNADRGNLLNILQMIQGTQGNTFNRNIAAAQFGQSIAQPVVGLDPTAVANIATGNANAAGAAAANQANIRGAQGQGFLQLAGNLAGYGMMNAMKTPTPTPKPTG